MGSRTLHRCLVLFDGQVSVDAGMGDGFYSVLCSSVDYGCGQALLWLFGQRECRPLRARLEQCSDQ